MTDAALCAQIQRCAPGERVIDALLSGRRIWPSVLEIVVIPFIIFL